jgi:hypothetical protein
VAAVLAAVLVLAILVVTPSVASWSVTASAPAVTVASPPLAVWLEDADGSRIDTAAEDHTTLTLGVRPDWIKAIHAEGTWVHPVVLRGTAPGSYGFRYSVTGPAGTDYVLFPVADAAGCTADAVPAAPDVTFQGETGHSFGDESLTQVFCLALAVHTYENTATATVDRFGTDADPQESASWHSLVVPQPAIEFTIETFITS